MMDVNNLLNMINLDIIMVSGGLILGIIICLFGLKFQKLVIAFVGLVVGFALGNIIVNTFGITEQALSIVIKFGLALVVGAFSYSIFESLLAIAAGVVIFILVAIFNSILSALIISSIYVIWELCSNRRVDYVLLDSIGVAIGWLLYEVIITII